MSERPALDRENLAAMKRPLESHINRRELLLVGAGVAMAKVLTVTTACAGTEKEAAPPDDRVAPERVSAAELAKLSAECCRVGQVCMQHCLDLLGKGDTSMAACAQTVNEMLAVCKATEVLALAGSEHLPSAAALCRAACESCEAACSVHAAHHRPCGDCASACRATVDAATLFG